MFFLCAGISVTVSAFISYMSVPGVQVVGFKVTGMTWIPFLDVNYIDTSLLTIPAISYKWTSWSRTLPFLLLGPAPLYIYWKQRPWSSHCHHLFWIFGSVPIEMRRRLKILYSIKSFTQCCTYVTCNLQMLYLILPITYVWQLLSTVVLFHSSVTTVIPIKSIFPHYFT